MKTVDIIRGRVSLLDFIKLVRLDNRPLMIGKHTKAITERLDRAIWDYEHGKSTHLIITVPFRHGKSEIVSRHFPPFFIGRNKEAEIILSTYGQTLSNELSRYARDVVNKSAEYRTLFS